MNDGVANASRALHLRPADAPPLGARVVASFKDIERGTARRRAAAVSVEKLIWPGGHLRLTSPRHHNPFPVIVAARPHEPSAAVLTTVHAAAGPHEHKQAEKQR